MPVFRFRGIDVFGKIHKGRLSAPTKEYLRQNLVLRGIVLLSAKPVAHLFILNTIATKDIILFYQTLAHLLQSGILLPDALLYLAQNSTQSSFQDAVYDISQKVISGASFSNAISEHPCIGQKTLTFIIQAGQESGNIQQACETIARYLQWKETTKKTMLSFLAMPLLTIGAIITLLSVISHVMVPRILDMFQLLEQKKAALLKNSIMFKILSFFSFSFFIITAIVLLSLGIILWRMYKTTRGNSVLVHLLLKIPYIKTLYLDLALSKLFFTLSLLLKNGSSTTKSLSIIAQFTPQIPLQEKTKELARRVKEGGKLSQALFEVFSLHDPYPVLILRVAENTGSVQVACETIASYYTNEIQKKVSRFLSLLQPILVLFVGLLIAGIMVGLYAPIAQFSLNL
jgi:type II secretory pathway component PulF